MENFMNYFFRMMNVANDLLEESYRLLGEPVVNEANEESVFEFLNEDGDNYVFECKYSKNDGEEYEVDIDDGVLSVYVYLINGDTKSSTSYTVDVPKDADVAKTTRKVDEENEKLIITIPKKVVEKKCEDEKKCKKYKKYARPTSTNFMHQKRDKFGRFIKGKINS